VHRGVALSPATDDADLLLFADADCWFEVGAMRAAVAMLARRNAAMLSLLPTLTSETWWERIAQPAAGMELIRQFPLDEINRREQPRRFANGQFMLFRKRFYEQLGGHEAVKDALLEDLAFARRARSVVGHEHHIAVLIADGLVRCRMYASLAEFRKGWKRIYAESAYNRAKRLQRDGVRLILTGVAMPLFAIACLGCSAVPLAMGDRPLALAMQMVGWASTLVIAVSLARIYLTQRVGPLWAACYPVGAWITAGILREAARDARTSTPTEWGGMTYSRDAEGAKK
jgi:chlorobactene glucosyltransferase